MNKIRDGDLYKVVKLHGKTFEIRYGYYEDFEKASGEPIPIFPDFQREPEYTKEGYPFVTQMQELCLYGKSKFKEGFCADCEYFSQGDELIGICTNKKTRKKLK